MSSRSRLTFILIVLAQVILVLGIVLQQEYMGARGTTVLLRTVPVDPRSLFQGDYVSLRYQIDRPSKELEISPGSIVYVKLGKDPINTESWDGLFIYDSIEYVTIVPESGESGRVWDDELFIKGRMTPGGHIDFGINTFFVPENRGHVIEETPSDDVNVVVTISSSGDAMIDDLLLYGVPFDDYD